MSDGILASYLNNLYLPYSREKSWSHCYKAFCAAHKAQQCSEETAEILALHLCAYLTSWGMYRASSFLFKDVDYRVHIPVVKMILEPQYDVLWDLRDDSATDTLWELSERIRQHYENCRRLVGKPGTATQILLTKILLGTMGCIPAYDTVVHDTLVRNKVCATFRQKSLHDMFAFYQRNKQEIDIWYDALRKAEGIESYPLMKAVDTYLWHETKGGRSI